MAKDFYEVLGVQAGDDVIVIKRRYRQLVRQYHPDISPNPDAAHEMMLAINEAWTILSDPAERAKYDRARHSAANARATPAGGTRVEGWVGGAGATAQAPTSTRPSPARGSTTRTRLLSMVFEAAEMYFFHGNAEDAIDACRRVLKIDPDSAEASALLGDIYAEQGKKADAVEMYQRAVRSQPHNHLYLQKLTALGGVVAAPPTPAPPPARAAPRMPKGDPRSAARQGRKLNLPPPPGATMSGSGTYVASADAVGLGVRDTVASPDLRKKMAAAAKTARSESHHVSTPAVNGVIAGAGTPASRGDLTNSIRAAERKRAIAGFVLIGAAIGVVAWSTAPGLSALGAGQPFDTESVASVALGALLVGAALPLLGLVQRCGRVKRGEPEWTGLPFLLTLAVVGAIYYPAAFVIFALLCLARRTWYRSVCTVMLLSVGWAAIFAANSRPFESHVLLQALTVWSGRAVFPFMVVGWALGSTASKG